MSTTNSETPAAVLAGASQAIARGRLSPRQVLTAIVVLAFCCLFWGLSFPVMQIAAGRLERAVAMTLGQSPGAMLKMATSATFNGWRFAAAAGIYFLLTYRRQHGYRRHDWLGGALVGVFFGGGMFLQLVGLKYTLPSVSGFLTALAVVLVPIGQAWVFRQHVGGGIWLAVLVALVGMLVLAQSNAGAVTAQSLANHPPLALLGEVLTILGAVLFTAQILAVDHSAASIDCVKLTTVSMAVAGLINAVGGLALGGGAFYATKLATVLISDLTFVWSAAALVVICTVVALHMMNLYQPKVAPATASVIYCLEPLFATMFSVLFGTERLTMITMAGGSVIMVAVLIAVRACAKRG